MSFSYKVCLAVAALVCSMGPTAPAPSRGAAAARSDGYLRLIVEPEAGMGQIYSLITSARSSVDLTMYELRDPIAEADLAADARRGVDVRVILDADYEQARNEPAFAYLTAHKAHVAWAPPGTIYHQKTLTIDNAVSVVMTGNLITEYYPTSRNFLVVDTNPVDVAAIVRTFDADYSGRKIDPPTGADLVWSPTNSQSVILSVIEGAHKTLAVEDEEMDDYVVTDALADAARRGVSVHVTMTESHEWDWAFAELRRAGVVVSLYPDTSGALYVHAKAIVADAGLPDQRAEVGSENFSISSLRWNRELGIVTTNPAIVDGLSAVMARDFAGGTK